MLHVFNSDDNFGNLSPINDLIFVATLRPNKTLGHTHNGEFSLGLGPNKTLRHTQC